MLQEIAGFKKANPLQFGHYIETVNSLRFRLLELEQEIDIYLTASKKIKATKSRGRHSFHNKQVAAGIKGSINDKLMRLKSVIRPLHKEVTLLTTIPISTSSFNQQETQTLELLDPIDPTGFNQGDFIEQIDFFNVTIAMIYLVLKMMRKK